MTKSPTKQLRDLAYIELQMAKRLRADDLYEQIKQRYSELCADYFDELHNDETTRNKIFSRSLPQATEAQIEQFCERVQQP